VAAVIAALLLAVLLWRTQDRGMAPPAPDTRTTIDHSAAPALQAVRHLSAAPAPAPVVPESTKIAATRAPAIDLPRQAAVPPPPSDVLPAVATPSPAAASPAAAPPVDTPQALSDLAVDERKALPPLKISMHLWNPDPAQRFVIVDGDRLREGDRVGDAVLTAIVADGIVLDWNGRKLKVPLR
jgi:general secretion pathway protein B